MAMFKEVWTLSGLNDRWQEVWYKQSNSIDTAIAIPDSIINARLAFLDELFAIEKIRVSDMANPRVTEFMKVNRGGTMSHGLGKLSSSGETIVYGLQSTNTGARRRLNVRAVPEIVYFGRSLTFPNGGVVSTLDGAVKSFVTLLAGQQYVINSRVRPGTTINKAIRVIRVDGSAANGTATLTLVAPFVVAPTSRIMLKQFSKKDLPGLNGGHNIQSLIGTTLIIDYTVPGDADVVTKTGIAHAEVYAENSTLDPTKTKFLFVGSRQVKNVAIGSRGARSARRSRFQS